MSAKYAAHIVTGEAAGLGDPEIIVMTLDEGMGAEEVERFPLGAHESLRTALDRLNLQHGYNTGEPTTTQHGGYWIVDVEKA